MRQVLRTVPPAPRHRAADHQIVSRTYLRPSEAAEVADRWAADTASDYAESEHLGRELLADIEGEPMTAPDVLALGRQAARNAIASYGPEKAPSYPTLPAFMALRYELRGYGAEITPETHATFVAAYQDEIGGQA